MADKTVVVLGGGTGGVVAARRLRRYLDTSDRVVLVERDPTYRFAPSFLWVMTGARTPERVTFDLRGLRRRGIEVVIADAVGIDTAGRTVHTSGGAFAYDRLVVALGAELAPETLPGFAEAAHTVYTLDGAAAAGRALDGFGGGRAVVFVSRLPYKCPAAPYESALLLEALLRKRGLRGRSSVDVYTPEPAPMPVAGPGVGAAVSELLEGRRIALHTERSVERIEPEARELVLAGGERVGYDFLLGVPPHRGPGALGDSSLADESGFIPVDRSTLAAGAEGVFAVGDAARVAIAGGKLLPKAGVFAHAEAEVVARRIAAELAGRAPSATFDGAGACFLELGEGLAAYASGNFYAEPGPEVSLRPPARRWHLLKVALEQYWLRRWA